jgi:hypothetical protein
VRAGLGVALYWKVLVCVVLIVLYALGALPANAALRGLTFVAIVYSALGFYLVAHLFHLA